MRGRRGAGRGIQPRGACEPGTMRYSRNVPAEPGYYWLREGDDEEIVEVWTDPARREIFFIHRCGSGEAREIGALGDAVWAGPIEAPAPPL